MTNSLRNGAWNRLAALLVILGGLTWAALYYAGKEDSRPPLNTVTVDRGDIEQTVTATGQLQPVKNVEVGSQISGNIAEILADFNSEVREGEILARLDTSSFEANVHQAEGELESAEADLDLARTEARRMEKLNERDLIPQSELDRALARLRQTEAIVKIHTHALERAKFELERCTIYSPVDGIVISRNVDVGQTVAASMTAPILFTIANDLTRMNIHSHVPEADIGGIRDEQRVEFTVDAYPQTFEGTVIQVRNQPIIEQHVVMYDTVIQVYNPDRQLKPGMTATVSIVTDEKSDALRIQNTALRARLPESIMPDVPELPSNENNGVWRIVYRLAGGDPDGTIEAVSVRTGMTDGIWTEVYEGLDEGDVLVTGVDLQAQVERDGRSGLFGPGPAQF